MLKFSNPYMFYFLLAIPLMVIALLLFMRWKRRRREQLVASPVEGRMIRDYSRGKVIGRFVLMMVVYAAFVLTLARPKFGTKVEKIKTEGFEFVIALDVSTSMLAEDIQPNRLFRSKQAISSLLDVIKSDGVGLVVFAGTADLQSTVTNDYASIKNLLPTINTDMLDVQGTSIAEAIRMSVKAFPKERKSGAAIVILTDGEDHEGAAVDEARIARKNGIIVHTIGIGTVKGGPIPMYEKGVLTGYKADNNQKTVVTKMNEAALKEVSDAGGGVYIRGVDPSKALKEVYKEMQSMQKSQRQELNEEGLEDRFQWVLALVLIVLIVELLMSERTSKWIKKIELFD